jgi:hypothetical protein
MTSTPNIGPDQPDPLEAADRHTRANPALVYRDDPHIEAVDAASQRATTVSRRFGGPRPALTRRDAQVDRLPDPGPSDPGSIDPGSIDPGSIDPGSIDPGRPC